MKSYRGIATLSLIVAIAGTLVLLTGLFLSVGTFLSPPFVVSAVEFVPLLVVGVAAVGWAIMLMNSRTGGRRGWSWDLLGQATDQLAVWMRGFYIVGVLAGIVSTVTGLVPTSGGQPDYDRVNNRYILNSHGKITVVTKAAYEHAVASQNRLFLGGAILFAAIGAPIALNEWFIYRRGRGLVP